MKWLTASWILFILWIVTCASLGWDNFFVSLARQIPYGDKIGHALLFGILTLLVNWSLQNRRISIGNWSLLLGSLVVFIVVITEEFTQLYFDTRTFDGWDILSDSIGILGFSYWSLYLFNNNNQQ